MLPIPEITGWWFSATPRTLLKPVLPRPSISRFSASLRGSRSARSAERCGSLRPSNTIYHLPEVNTFNNTRTILQQIGSNGPLAIALDSSENPIVAEAINRVTFYFAKLVVRNAFTFTSTRPLTPGMWAQAAPLGKTFSASDEVHQNPPYPTTAAGLQMLVNGTPSGIYSWEQQAYMNFVIPWEAPTSGTAEFLLFNPTTKEIVAAGTVGMTVADPAFRTTNFQGWGQVLAINVKPDGTQYGLNGPQNPISLGDTLQLALTGQGLVANPPADGFPPPPRSDTDKCSTSTVSYKRRHPFRRQTFYSPAWIPPIQDRGRLMCEFPLSRRMGPVRAILF